VSLLVHGSLAALLWLLPAEAHRGPALPPIEVVERRPPEPPPPKPREPEPPAPQAAREPRLAMTRKIPPRVTAPPPDSEEPPEKPSSPDEPPPVEDTGPKTFGLQMSGTTQAPAGQGVAVPRGDSLEVSPSITKRGKPKEIILQPRQAFKSSYARGEEAPVAVLTTRPKVTQQVTAEYPEKMRDLGIEGRVILELTVDASGRVVAASVTTSLRPEFDRVALAAARRLIFSPATVNGTPVKVKIPYTFTFVLD
jgi:TonB family protein